MQFIGISIDGTVVYLFPILSLISSSAAILFVVYLFSSALYMQWWTIIFPVPSSSFSTSGGCSPPSVPPCPGYPSGQYRIVFPITFGAISSTIQSSAYTIVISLFIPSVYAPSWNVFMFSISFVQLTVCVVSSYVPSAKLHFSLSILVPLGSSAFTSIFTFPLYSSICVLYFISYFISSPAFIFHFPSSVCSPPEIIPPPTSLSTFGAFSLQQQVISFVSPSILPIQSSGVSSTIIQFSGMFSDFWVLQSSPIFPIISWSSSIFSVVFVSVFSSYIQWCTITFPSFFTQQMFAMFSPVPIFNLSGSILSKLQSSMSIISSLMSISLSYIWFFSVLLKIVFSVSLSMCFICPVKSFLLVQ